MGLAVQQYYQEEYKHLIHHPPARKPLEVEVLVGKKEHSLVERSKRKIQTDQKLLEKKRAQKPLNQEEKVQLIRNRQS